jgi:UDPglucose 6-dehydrogenase
MDLKERILKHEVNLGIIGTGYVGLVTGACLAEMGNHVLCEDIDAEKILALDNDKMPIFEKGLHDLIRKNKSLGRISFTSDFDEVIEKSDIILITVGTPPGPNGEADLSQIKMVIQNLSRKLYSYKIIIIRSTVPVGIIEIIKDIFAGAGKLEGKDFDIAIIPEFLREGNAVFDFFHPARVIIGVENMDIAETLSILFVSLNVPIIFTSPIAAQIIKYASNSYLASRISFINEIANICDRVGADVFEIIEGMKYDKRIGGDYFSPGIGFGGPCLPKDLMALIKTAEKYDYNPDYLISILEKNDNQIKVVIDKTKEVLGNNLRGLSLGILGLTFKDNTNDVRNSQAIEIIKALYNLGAIIKVYDPQGIEGAKKLLYGVAFCENAYCVVDKSDALIFLTAWDEFKSLDLNKVKALLQKPIIIDAVNVLNLDKVKEAGFVYRGVGRSL